jgi:hypothetical protein
MEVNYFLSSIRLILKKRFYILSVSVHWLMIAAVFMGLTFSAWNVTPAHAATITVTNANDSGAGSLRQAIAVAIAGDTIHFDDDYTIILESTLTIDKNLTIDGQTNNITLDGQNEVRVYDVYPDVTVYFENFTIKQGYQSEDNFNGGVYNQGTLSMNEITFSSNNGSVFNDSAAVLSISDCDFISNFVSNMYSGPIEESPGISNKGTLIISNSSFSEQIGCYSGAITNYEDGTASISSSSFDHNQGLLTGAIFNYNGEVSVDESTFNENFQEFGDTGGGAILNYIGNLTVTDTLFYSNTSGSEGAVDIGMGGAIATLGDLTVSGSTFDANKTWGNGAAIASTTWKFGDDPLPENSTITLTNNTFRENTALPYQSNPSNGGAVYIYPAHIPYSVTFTNNTFSENAADHGGNLSFKQDTSSESLAVNFYNNIMQGAVSGGNCSSSVVISVTSSHNLADDASCGTGFTNTSSILLGAYGNYGGSTSTIPLLPGSSAINAGDSCPTTDQRGKPRYGTCDIGAFESQGFNLSITGGNNQTALVSSAFSDLLDLSVTANESGEPVKDGQISFSAPSSGASIAAPITFGKTISASGTVTSTVSANAIIGSYTVSASAAGASDADFSLYNSGAPTAATSAATPVTSSAEVLNGTVNANNSSTTVTFEYGLTTAYGTSVTASQSPVAGLTDTAVSYLLSGLQPNTTYHYRVKASNSAATVYGDDFSFTTLHKATTMTSLEIDPNPSALGNTIIMTATIIRLSGTPTGSVSFKEGVTILGKADLNGSGVATFSISDLSAGKHTITAEYSGDQDYASSVSNEVYQVVNGAGEVYKIFLPFISRNTR